MELSKISDKYKNILAKTEPYILSHKGSWEYFDLNPWGKAILEENQFDCMSMQSAKFTDLLHSLDGLAFGPMGMPMQKWVFYDCGEMPGGIFGFGVKASELTETALKEFGVDASYEGLIPISMYITIPMQD